MPRHGSPDGGPNIPAKGSYVPVCFFRQRRPQEDAWVQREWAEQQAAAQLASALVSAVKAGDCAAARQALDKEADVDCRDRDGWPVLHLGAWRDTDGHFACALLLLERGADKGSRDLNGWSALTRAAFSGNLRCTQLLLERGCDANVVDTLLGNTPLHWASIEGHCGVVRLLLERGAEAAVANREGKTPAEVARNDAVSALFGQA